MGDGVGRRLESQAGVGDEHDKGCSQGPAAMCDGLCSCRGSEGGSGGRNANVGDRSAIGCSQGPSATVLVIETCVATRKGAEIGSDNGVDGELDIGCSPRPSCNVW